MASAVVHSVSAIDVYKKLSPLAAKLLSLWGEKTYSITPFNEEVLTCEQVVKITGLSEERIGKAMVVSVDKMLAITLIPASKRLDIDAVKVLFKATKVYLVNHKDLPARTGMIVGAVTPLICLERSDIHFAIDETLLPHSEINISTGDPAYGITIAPADLHCLGPIIGRLTA